MVEDEIDYRPRAIVNPSRWRNVIRAHKDQRPVHILQPVLFGVLPGDVCHDRHQRSDPEEVQQSAVDLSGAVQSPRADETPDYSCDQMSDMY